MKNPGILTTLLAGVVIAGTFTACADKKNDDPKTIQVADAKPDEEVKETPKAEIVVSAVEYYKDYKANEVSADEKYKGKNIEITGKVESIEKDMFDNPFVTLTSGEFELGVHCTLANKGDAMSLKVGQKITLTGEGGGMTVGIPSLSDCKTKALASAEQ